jgi:UDP-N-acetylmuramoylalanine--D-glutamate ligase
VAGFAMADNLTHLGARVLALDESDAGDRPEKARLLEVLGAVVRLGPGSADKLPDEVDLVVTSPGWHPSSPLLAQAVERGIPVWGEMELAWRLRDPDRPAPWLGVTGTNGKTTTTRMLHAMLHEAGLRSVACGNIGVPIVEVVMDPTPYDVLAVEVSAFQMHFAPSVRFESAAVLNIAEDHLDWYSSLEEYAGDKGRVYQGVERACVYNVADPTTRHLVEEADVVEGARAIGFTLGIPDVGMLGVVDGVLADRAFIDQRRTNAAELCTVEDLYSPAPHFVANALAAAALARSHGVTPAQVRAALRHYRPDPHRIATVASVDEVTYVDDSKATNPHAAESSLLAYDSVVWIAGGLAKGATFDTLVERARDHLRGVVLLGRDRDVIGEALARHAPDVPVIVLTAGDTSAMDTAVRAAAGLARPGDTVLLAPGCASMDMFDNYGARGDAFAEAVTRLPA